HEGGGRLSDAQHRDARDRSRRPLARQLLFAEVPAGQHRGLHQCPGQRRPSRDQEGRGRLLGVAESTVLTISGAIMSEMTVSVDWLSALRRYFLASAAGNLVWEFAQLPLYTIWYQGSVREIAFAAVHCTGGDVLIA